MPRVSILLPVRNAAATLPAALRSIARQSFRDWELIAVDDGSTDASAELLAKTPQTLLLRQPPLGLVAALRSAVARSSAPLLARMDADDLMHPERLALQVARFDAAPRVDVLATRVRSLGASGEGMRRYLRWQNALVSHDEMTSNLFVESPIAHPSVMLRRNALDAAGGYVDPGWAEDFDLWHRLSETGARFEKLPRPLLSWRDGPARLTRTHPMYAEKAFRAAKLHYFLRHPLCRSPITIWGAGPIGKAWARDLRRAGLEVPRLIDIDPAKIGRTLGGGARVVSVEEGLATRAGLILGAVGSRGARDLIRARLRAAGLVEGVDFLFVA